MAGVWTIVGQAGKGMDATSRTLEDLVVTGGRMTFRNLGADTLTFSMTLASLSSTTEPVPDLAQTVELFRNGARFFKGHVTGLNQQGRRVDVTVSGPWWWLERVFLESAVTDATSATGDRPTFAFPPQSLTTSLTSLLNKAIALGVPMSVGTLAVTFDTPERKLNQINFAQAIAEVVRYTPDMVLFFDYSGATPAVKTVRRLSGLGAGTAVPLTRDARLLSSFQLNPVTELQVSQVRVPYLTRATNGAKKFASQNSGAAALGKVAIFPVSGDELDTFLPKDLLNYVDVQTGGATLNADNVIRFDPAVSDAARRFGISGIGETYGFVELWEGNLDGGTGSFILKDQTATLPTCVDEAGLAVDTAGKYLVVDGKLDDWAMTQLGGIRVKYSGTWFAYFGVAFQTTANLPGTFLALRTGAVSGVSWDNQYTARSIPNYRFWLTRPFAFSGVLINKSYPTKKRVYRASDYLFRFPPAGFAAGLLAAQNYIPYEGRFTIPEDDAGGTRYMMRAVNFTNSQAAHASVAAMVTEESLELGTGITSVYLGRPARFDYQTVVNAMRTDSNAQITYL